MTSGSANNLEQKNLCSVLEPQGLHLIAELSGCLPELLGDCSGIEALMRQAADQAHAHVLEAAFHHFSPLGVSGVLVIAESHFSIHTWPELGYAAADFYTCGTGSNPRRALQCLAEALQAKKVVTTAIKRGVTLKDCSYGHCHID